MSGLMLIRPMWLWALLPLAALALWSWRARGAGGWERVVDPALMPVLRRLGLIGEAGGRGIRLLPFAAAAFLVLGLAGPGLPRAGEAEYRALDPLILLLDLSPSTLAEPGPLSDLQTAAAQVVMGAGARPIGIMGYAADGYLLAAPAADPATALGVIGALTQDVMPVVGSRPDLALSLARDLFGARDGLGIGGADLVLISDGGGAGDAHGPRALEEASRLASDGARLWTLALPRVATGAPPPAPDALAALARAGGGAGFATAEIPALSARIEAARQVRLMRDQGEGRGFDDLGPWFLLPALALLLPLWRRQR